MNILMKIEMQRPNIFNFKAFGMMNLSYEIRICQKIYIRVTMTVYIKCVVRFYVHKTLFFQEAKKAKITIYFLLKHPKKMRTKVI